MKCSRLIRSDQRTGRKLQESSTFHLLPRPIGSWDLANEKSVTSPHVFSGSKAEVLALWVMSASPLKAEISGFKPGICGRTLLFKNQGLRCTLCQTRDNGQARLFPAKISIARFVLTVEPGDEAYSSPALKVVARL